MIIMKFGGTSVRDREAIERVTDIVRGRLRDKPLVVVSALAKITRLLCQIAEEAQAQHTAGVDNLLSSLRDRHTSLAAELLSGTCGGAADDFGAAADGSGFGTVQGCSGSASDCSCSGRQLLSDCFSRVNTICDDLSEFVRGVCQIGELSQRSYARIVSTGEILSSVIVSAAMNARGIRCGWLDAREMIVTDTEYMSASVDLSATEANVRRIVPEASKGVDVLLTQGFIASSVDGAASVLGFEGSDYSAAIFGMALGAERVEIWTDVDGIRSADPRIVHDTERVARVSYEEASEMALLGARVLHPLTTLPARKRNIPVCVLNSMNPTCEGSFVTRDADQSGPKAVAMRDDIVYLEIRPGETSGLSALLQAVSCEAEANAVRLCLVSVSDSLLCITVDAGKNGTDAFIEAISSRFDVLVHRDKAQVSVIGKDVVLVPGLADKMLRCAKRIYMVVHSPSLLSSSIVIDKYKAVEAAAALHKALFRP